MKITPTLLPEVWLIEPKVFTDERGYFFESFNQCIFEKVIGRSVSFVQDNHSLSKYGVLRGLHYQTAPYAQGKLVRVVSGEVFDVAVDIRRNSPRFGQWTAAYLTSENKHQLWIPEGFAHGFLTLSSSAELVYKTTNYYAPEFERCVKWNDAQIEIKWPLPEGINWPLLSTKDLTGIGLHLTEETQFKNETN